MKTREEVQEFLSAAFDMSIENFIIVGIDKQNSSIRRSLNGNAASLVGVLELVKHDLLSQWDTTRGDAEPGLK